MDLNLFSKTFFPDLKESKALHEIMYLVLIAGNFLNAVSTHSFPEEIFIVTLWHIKHITNILGENNYFTAAFIA